VGKVLEPMRADGKIGASLAAEVSVFTDLEALELAAHPGLAEELRFLFITSALEVGAADARPADAVAAEGGGAWIFARPSEHAKCVRCWHYRPEVGSFPDDPELCGRCVENVNGAGETRRYF
jgi:isoleucyl-tRNA synthetase